MGLVWGAAGGHASYWQEQLKEESYLGSQFKAGVEG